jgi:hypothetical protein
VIHADHDDRASTSKKPAAEALRFLDAVLPPTLGVTLSAKQLESFAVKLLRTHLMDVLGAALTANDPTAELPALADAARRIVAVAPSAASILSRREGRIVRELLGVADVHRLAADHAVLTDYRRPSNLLPASARYLLHREAMPRFLAAVAFTP